MEGIFTKNAYCKFDTDCTDFAPPRALFGLTGSCVRNLQGEVQKNGISKQFENFEAYGWKKAS